MTDLLLSPWPYGYALIVVGAVLSYVLVYTLLLAAALNSHLRWHRELQDHAAEKHQVQLYKRRKRDARRKLNRQPLADVLQKALDEEAQI